jgi:CRISPR/Cas system CSM-associated protein Csm5 (group 7 of RAMP superfamily)
MKRTPKLKYGNPIGKPFSIAGTEFRWHESPTDHFRLVGFADTIARRTIRHKGWFTDDFQDGVTRGIVFRLPNNRGFVAGCTDPFSDGPCILEIESIEDEIGAALRADRIAQLYAEMCKEDEAKSQAEFEKEEAEALAKENQFAESALTELCDQY